MNDKNIEQFNIEFEEAIKNLDVHRIDQIIEETSFLNIEDKEHLLSDEDIYKVNLKEVFGYTNERMVVSCVHLDETPVLKALEHYYGLERVYFTTKPEGTFLYQPRFIHRYFMPMSEDFYLYIYGIGYENFCKIKPILIESPFIDTKEKRIALYERLVDVFDKDFKDTDKEPLNNAIYNKVAPISIYINIHAFREEEIFNKEVFPTICDKTNLKDYYSSIFNSDGLTVEGLSDGCLSFLRYLNPDFDYSSYDDYILYKTQKKSILKWNILDDENFTDEEKSKERNKLHRKKG